MIGMRVLAIALGLAIAGIIAMLPVPTWQRLTEHAPFPGSYNFPVHVTADGTFVALHPEGTWTSRDGAAWTKSELPFSGVNSAYLPYVQHDGATWTFGKLKGNYEDFQIDPVVQRTRDYKTWEQVGASPSLPHVIFYAAASFQGALWIIGGYNGDAETSQVWKSTDGLAWTRVVEKAQWSARSGAKAVVFGDRLYLIGGGEIDGAQANDVWSSANGITWIQRTSSIAPERPTGYAPVVFDNRIWLIGANRAGEFKSETLVSTNGITWWPQSAPWSPRGGVAAWSDGRSLFITGGKYSYEKNGEPVFVYSNDVWQMQGK